MGERLSVVGFDADDTLWQNESFFRLTEDRFAELLSDFAEDNDLRARLLEFEKANIGHYGFGIKGFMLSMIETAVAVTDGRVDGKVIAEILAMGQEMLRHPIHLLPHVEETLARVADRHPLVLITKGDLLHQEQKLAASGLGELFAAVEIVSEKHPGIYDRAFSVHGDGAERAMMVGNSMKSDIRPALDAGAHAVYVPHGLTWALEHAETPEGHPRYHELPDLGGLPELIERLE
ncbi:HAD family hydrolase [Gymnodinialimonas ceratoperidinii]|uniref:HAD family hydrolase n=1 Tax=Gymnodinialimonas ceratoperidinii TaxID=2856823 RepID=A0A8F6YBA4_9RHOB|nr:HAD family hydrolase [Gymnodinialimonas ceratoperidinii]QXT40358.1 HAD family hydrolase [Gymnodinialimonas ceratoperidinii]